MTENEIRENDQKKVALELIKGYLANNKAHPADNLVRLIADYATTPAGALLFGIKGQKTPKAVGRAALKHLQDSRECVVDGTGKAQTVRLPKAPKWAMGKNKPLVRNAEGDAKAAMLPFIENRGGHLITQFHDVVDKAVRPKLKDLIAADGIPETFPFALCRRVPKRLIDLATKNLVLRETT